MPAGRSRFKRLPVPSLSCVLLQKRKREPNKGLKDFQRNFTKREFFNKTFHRVAQDLVSKYNISLPRAYALMGYVGAQAMINKYGKVSGNNEQNYKVYYDIYDRYKSHLTEQDRIIIDHLKIGSEFQTMVANLTNSALARGRLYANELQAYLDGYHKRSMKYSDAMAHWENVIKLPALAVWLWSKPAFWLLMNMFVFDVSTVVAQEIGDKKKMWQQYEDMLPYIYTDYDDDPNKVFDFDAIKLGYGNTASWYDRRPYLSKEAKAAFYVYDNIISEAAREVVAAGLSHLAQKYLITNGLRLLASTILTIASYIPNVVGVGARIATIINAIANFTEKSKIVWLLGQIGIEWQFEKWAAFHEHNILQKSFDFFFNYKPIREILSEEDVDEFFDLWKKLLKNPFGYLSKEESDKFWGYLDKLNEYRDKNNVAELINKIMKSLEYKAYYEQQNRRLKDFYDFVNDFGKTTQDALNDVYKDMKDLVDEAIEKDENINISEDASQEFCSKYGHIEGVQYLCNMTKYAEHTNYVEGNLQCKRIRYGTGGVSKSKGFACMHCDDIIYSGTSITSSFGKSVTIKRTSNFPLVALINIFVSDYLIFPINLDNFQQEDTEGQWIPLTGTYTKNDITYTYNLLYKGRHRTEGGDNEPKWHLNIDSFKGTINVSVPYMPTVLMLPVIYKKDFERYSFPLLHAGKAYTCVGYRYKGKRIKYIPFLKEPENFFFKQNGYGRYIEIEDKSFTISTSSYSCPPECSPDFTCYHSRNTPIGASGLRRDYEIYSYSNCSVSIHFRYVQGNTHGGESSICEGAWCEFDCVNAGDRYYNWLELYDYNVNPPVGVIYNIQCNKDNPQPKITYLEPIDITQKRTGRSKIICFPYNPLARGG